MEVGQYERACEKFETSQRWEPAPGTLLNLGRCYEALGRTRSAWEAFTGAHDEALRRGDELRLQVARDFRERVEKQLIRLRIVVPEPVPRLLVEHEGQPVDRASWGTAFPVDPGRHRVTAVAPGFTTWEVELEVAGAGQTVEVVIPRLQQEPAPLVEMSREADEPSSSVGAWKWLPAGVAASAFAACGALGLSAWSTWNEAKSLCSGGSCPEQAHELSATARSRANFATLSCGLGAVAGGAFVWLWASEDSGREPGASAGVAVAPGHFELLARF